jgi:hypothetical protein
MSLSLLADINWLAVVVAVIWNFVLGFVWYAQFTPTGRIWMKSQGLSPDFKPEPGAMLKGILLQVLGAALTMTVLAYLILGLSQSPIYPGPLDWTGGLYAGLFAWAGFLLPVQLGALAWERKGLAVTAVNAGYHLVSLVVAGIILAAWQ